MAVISTVATLAINTQSIACVNARRATPITLPVSHLGTIRDPWGAMRAAFETSITINRREFGLTWNPALETGLILVGAEVQINLSIEAIAK